MKRLRFNLVFCFVSFILSGFNTYCQETNRKVIYKLGPNQIIYSNEYYLAEKDNKYGFSCIVRDTVKKEVLFIVNSDWKLKGNWTGLGDNANYYLWDVFHVRDIDVFNDTMMFLSYNNQKNIYLNGKNYGPFESTYFNYNPTGNKLEKKFDFIYSVWDTVDSISNYYGCYNDSIYFISQEKKIINDESNTNVICQNCVSKENNFSDSNNPDCQVVVDYAYSDKYHVKDLQWSVIKKGDFILHTYPKGSVVNFQSDNLGNYAYVFIIENKYYVNFNEDISGPYDEVIRLQLGDNKIYTYTIKEGNMFFTFINRRKNKGLPIVDNNKWDGDKIDFNLINDSIFSYAFCDETNKNYLNINGKVVGPYNCINSFVASRNGFYLASLGCSDSIYVTSNLWNSNKFDNVYNLHIEDSCFYFEYVIDDKTGVCINGIEYGPYDNLYNLEVKTKNDFSFCFTKASSSVLYFFENGKISKSRFDKRNLFGLSVSKFVNNFWESIKSDMVVFSDDLKIKLVSNYSNSYVRINNKKYGSAPAINAWFNSDKKCFVWSAVEGSELVVYEVGI